MPSRISPAFSGVDALRNPAGAAPVPSHSILTLVAAATVTDCSLAKKSSAAIVPTRVFESGDHAPIECGCLRAYCSDGLRCPPVGVSLAQHRVDRGTLDLVIAGADILFRVGLRILGVIGKLIALRLKLRDGGLELGA